jgi:hypothetical protein
MIAIMILAMMLAIGLASFGMDFGLTDAIVIDFASGIGKANINRQYGKLGRREP